MHNIVESQIIQEKVGELTVKIVPKETYSLRDEAQLISAFAERLGPDVRITVEYVQSIPRTENAKFKWVISRIKPAF
jgi:phenylacetate-CoA ligase